MESIYIPTCPSQVVREILDEMCILKKIKSFLFAKKLFHL